MQDPFVRARPSFFHRLRSDLLACRSLHRLGAHALTSEDFRSRYDAAAVSSQHRHTLLRLDLHFRAHNSHEREIELGQNPRHSLPLLRFVRVNHPSAGQPCQATCSGEPSWCGLPSHTPVPTTWFLTTSPECACRGLWACFVPETAMGFVTFPSSSSSSDAREHLRWDRLPFPATLVTPLEEFPLLTAAPHHCGRCPHAVEPGVSDPAATAALPRRALTGGSHRALDFEALLREQVRTALPRCQVDAAYPSMGFVPLQGRTFTDSRPRGPSTRRLERSGRRSGSFVLGANPSSGSPHRPKPEKRRPSLFGWVVALPKPR